MNANYREPPFLLSDIYTAKPLSLLEVDKRVKKGKKIVKKKINRFFFLYQKPAFLLVFSPKTLFTFLCFA